MIPRPIRVLLWTVLALFATRAPLAAGPAHTFAIGEREFLLDGKPFLVRCGEIHFARIPREYWRHRLQMCHAMGLNTVCIYLFWNFHEWEEGHFDWSGQADAAEFCRMAQEEGLWVLLRPGPYSCAEWEMGGLPWWLLKREGIKLRTTDPAFLEPARRYLQEVARVFGPLQVTRGGPLLMVQVENEYGSFGRDPAYMGALRQALLDSGITVPLFACNPPGDIKNGFRPDLFQVVNFGRGAEGAFKTLREFQPTGPLMNGEFYPGWFDAWGRKHATGAADQVLQELDYMLGHGMSFSIYMAHGGTSFGLWSGADRPFIPDTSSYDYDAPISEAGWPTEKFGRIRALFAQHLLPGETLPPVPARNPVAPIAPFALPEIAPVFANLPPARHDDRPRPIEQYDHSRGCTAYRTTLPAGPAGALTAQAANDFAWVFLDGRPVGVMDRRSRRFQVQLPAREKPARLDVLVESVGRVNFGREVFDPKGLHAPVEFTPRGAAAVELKGWDISPLPLDATELSALRWQQAGSGATAGPAFRRGAFELARPADTFLDLRTWGKGVVWVNGHCLGRFWNIGPTQTMYCPGPWLLAGRNEVIVLDLLGPAEARLAGLAQPILDELHPEKDFGLRPRAGGTFSTAGIAPAHEGLIAAGGQWQEARFARPAKGRYLCFEALGSHDGGPVAALAELDALGADGQPLLKSDWRIAWADSEDPLNAAGDPEHAVDGQSATSWATKAGKNAPGYPHRLVIDLGKSLEVTGIRCLPRAGDAALAGRIKQYRVYVADRPFGLTPAP